MSDVVDPEVRLCYLLVYGWRYRQRPGRHGKPVRSKTISTALCSIGKGISHLGAPDPRFAAPGSSQLHPLLKDFCASLERQDDPTSRAHPANVTILRHLCSPEAGDDLPRSPLSRHLIDLSIIGFFWLLRPAEYLLGSGQTRSTAFRLCDASFVVDDRAILATDASLNDLDVSRILRATLTFNDQKNAVRGEQITHAATTDPQLCPCKALARLCATLRAHGAAAATPLYTYYPSDGPPLGVTPDHLTAALKASARATQPSTGIPPDLISARSVRPGGATALLCSGVESDVIQLLGRWRSDAMLRYLRVTALATRDNHAQRMLLAGDYTFAPNTCTPDHALPVPVQAPRAFLSALDRENLYHAD